MIAVDTNLLIYAHRAAVPEHRAAQRALERASRHSQGWGIALPSVAEFWSVVTHPACRGRPSTAEEAGAFLEALVVEAGAVLWRPGLDHWKRLLKAAKELRLQGPRIFDLQIGLVALQAGAREIWTHDGHFVAPPGLRVHDPI